MAHISRNETRELQQAIEAITAAGSGVEVLTASSEGQNATTIIISGAFTLWGMSVTSTGIRSGRFNDASSVRLLDIGQMGANAFTQHISFPTGIAIPDGIRRQSADGAIDYTFYYTT